MNLADLKKAGYYLRRNGLKNTIYAVCERLSQQKEQTYDYREPDAEVLNKQCRHTFQIPTMFSIVVPLYKTPEDYLTEMIDSVMNQTYGNLELILADATEDDSVEKIVQERYLKSGRPGVERIRYFRLPQNEGISGNSNQALSHATGDYVGLLDHDDVLTPDALYEMALRIEAMSLQKEAPMLLYSDEDKCNQDRTVYYEPHFKEDFNPDLLLSNNYICHFLVIRKELIQELGFRREYDGAQDFDLVLRAAEKILKAGKSVAHIPKVLYHWRCHTGSTAQNPQSKQYAYEAGKRAVQDMADRLGWNAKAVHLKHLGFYGLVYEPDLFAVRTDIGAVGGRIMCRGRIAYGAYSRNGDVLYQGLKEGYSGYMHRGVLFQEVFAVDIRLLRLNAACRDIFEQVTGVSYVEDRNGFFDWKTLPEGADYPALSIVLGKTLSERGYRICWDPSLFCRLPADHKVFRKGKK